MKIVTIIGARPQFIKAAPVSRAIHKHNRDVKRPQITEVMVHTGQHYDNNLSQVFFDELGIQKPDYNLGVGSGSHGKMTGAMLVKIEEVLLEEDPDLVLVYGDTNTTLAGALAAVKLHMPIAHIEAGLRSFNRRMPEEINRVLTDHVSTFLFCPTPQSIENLKAEGIVSETEIDNISPSTHRLPRKVALVGDVMFDTALYYKQFTKEPRIELPEEFILATIHRAENTDEPERLKSIFQAFEKINQEIPIILPLHPRTQRKIQSVNIQTEKFKNNMIEPVSYLEMIYLLEKCTLVMTDSGGLQKEAFFFQKPCITLRNETEWVELVEQGYNRVAGTETGTIYNAFKIMMDKKIDSKINLYGSGDTGRKIVNILNITLEV